MTKQFCPGCGAFKSKETCLCDRNGNTFTLNSYYDISLLMFLLYCEGNLAKLNEKLPETFDRSGNSVKFLWPDGSPTKGPSSTQYSCWTILKKIPASRHRTQLPRKFLGAQIGYLSSRCLFSIQVTRSLVTSIYFLHAHHDFIDMYLFCNLLPRLNIASNILIRLDSESGNVDSGNGLLPESFFMARFTRMDCY